MNTSWEELKTLNDARGNDRLEHIRRIQCEAFIRGAMTARGYVVIRDRISADLRLAERMKGKR